MRQYIYIERESRDSTLGCENNFLKLFRRTGSIQLLPSVRMHKPEI